MECMWIAQCNCVFVYICMYLTHLSKYVCVCVNSNIGNICKRSKIDLSFFKQTLSGITGFICRPICSMELTCKGILSISPKNRILKSSPSPDKQIVEILLQMIEFFAEKGVGQLSSTIQSAYCWELAGKQLLFTSFVFVYLWTCICVFVNLYLCISRLHSSKAHLSTAFCCRSGNFFCASLPRFLPFLSFCNICKLGTRALVCRVTAMRPLQSFFGNFHRNQQNHLWKCVECWKLFGNDTICRRCPIHKYIFVIPRFKGWSSIADAMKVMFRLLNIDWRILLRRRSGRKV